MTPPRESLFDGGSLRGDLERRAYPKLGRKKRRSVRRIFLYGLLHTDAMHYAIWGVNEIAGSRTEPAARVTVAIPTTSAAPAGSLNRMPDSLFASAKGRDPADVADEWVARALEGESWETRDDYPHPDGEPKQWVERGVGDGCVRFIDTALTSAEACVIERLLMVARGETDG